MGRIFEKISPWGVGILLFDASPLERELRGSVTRQ